MLTRYVLLPQLRPSIPETGLFEVSIGFPYGSGELKLYAKSHVANSSNVVARPDVNRTT